MNRRTAQELYLAVVPIYQSGDQFCLSGHGEPIEYALKMKQFPPGSLFSDLLEQGQLTPRLMQALAQQADSESEGESVY